MAYRPYGESANDLIDDPNTREWVVCDLRAKIRAGLLATARLSEVVQVACSVEVHSERQAALALLESASLSSAQQRYLAESLCALANATTDLRGGAVQAVDGALRRLARILPTEHLRTLAPLLLRHPRKGRRRAMVAALHRVPAPSEAAAPLFQLFECTGEQVYLEVIARSPEAVVAVGCDVLLEGLVDSYWRMRVVASVIMSGATHLEALAVSRPEDFVGAVGWVAGRPGLSALAAQHSSLVDQLITESPSNLDLLSAAVWTYTKLANAERLRMLDARLAARFPDVAC